MSASPFDPDPALRFPPSPPPPQQPPTPQGFWAHWLESYNFPFRDPKWAEKLVLLPLVLLIPIVGWMLLMGWHVQLAQSLLRQQGLPTPDWRRIFWQGLQVMLVTLVHALLAVLLCTLLWASGWLEPMPRSHTTFWEQMLTHGLLLLIWLSVFAGIWLLLITPLLQAAIVRWLLHDQWTRALNPLGNAVFLLRHLGAFVRRLPHALLSWLVLAIASVALSFTMLGLLLVPVVLVLHYASDAYDLNALIERLRSPHSSNF